MPAGKDFTTGNRGSAGKKNANCSFCRKSYRDVGPLVEGPSDVYICGECIELCQSILEQERRRRGGTKPLFSKVPTPREIVEHLNQYVIGQDATKKMLSVAVHNHYKRLMLSADAENDVEVEKSNIMLIGPDRVRQDAAGPDAGPLPAGPVRHRRRHDAHRSRVCRRGR